YYLTKDIANEGELGDPGTLKKFTISSEELTGWINAIPALKQVLILDACNSGQIIKNITGSTKRLNSNQIRALDRMKDRTGLFVLAGSASDKVSYEAGQYGQGLLTYALLKNIRGVDAKSDDVDVMEWFQYARNEVPRLAKSINGIQTPMLGFPSHGASFDIGIRSEEVKANIPIGDEKPVVIRSNFFNEISFKDDLKLADQLETLFLQETEKGADANLIYVDVSDYPSAYSLGGLYKTTDGKITSIKVKLFKGEAELMELDVLAAETAQEVVSAIFEAVLDELYFNE
ncbi:MAG: caspase family protein, partial [Saprospiraceae bacterium]|nr:caspase family protein [Saprospiraceae bacterium]